MEQSDEHSILSPTGFLVTRIKGQQQRPKTTKVLPTFYRNLEEALDERGAPQNSYMIVQNY